MRSVLYLEAVQPLKAHLGVCRLLCLVLSHHGTKLTMLALEFRIYRSNYLALLLSGWVYSKKKL